MTRTPAPQRPLALVGQTWLRNFVAAALVLLSLKYGLVLNTVFGTEAFEPAYKALPKSLLFLGWDLLSAALFGVAVTLLCLPWLRRPGSRVVVPLSATLQAVHALVATFSFFTCVFSGVVMTKATIDLAFLDQPNADGEGTPAIWASAGPYFTPGVLGSIALAGALAILAVVYGPRVLRRLGRGWKRFLAFFLVVETALTLVLLPFLFTGVLWGARVRSEGLERSPIHELAWSYLKPALAHVLRTERHFADPFRFDLTSPFPPERVDGDNPLRGAHARRTNVVVIVLESIGQIYLRERPDAMPFLTSVGTSRPGVYFGNHYTTWPMTIKASFSLFCSEHPYADWERETVINPAIPCRALPDVAHDAGYFTAIVFSGDLAYDRRTRFLKHHELDVLLDSRNQPGREAVWKDSWGLDEQLTIRNTLELVRGVKDRPFLVFYEMEAGHHPYACNAEHLANPLGDDRANYLRALRYVDDRIRDVYESFEREGLADDTLFVVVSDHGEGFGQHPDSFYHGAKIFQEEALVPLVMFGPQVAHLTATVPWPTSHIDVAPTILGLLGLNVPCTMKGRDLVTTSRHDLMIVAGRAPGEQYGLVDDRWKYILEANGADALYDVVADPGETTNRIDGQPERARVYRERVTDWRDFSIQLIENYAEILSKSDCGRSGPR
jgi:arylsulfatase A-like enzyme